MNPIKLHITRRKAIDKAVCKWYNNAEHKIEARHAISNRGEGPALLIPGERGRRRRADFVGRNGSWLYGKQPCGCHHTNDGALSQYIVKLRCSYYSMLTAGFQPVFFLFG